MLKKLISSLMLAVLLFPSFPAVANAATETTGQQPLIISEVKTDGRNTVADESQEFVELFNPNTIAVTVSGWQLIYDKQGVSEDCINPVFGSGTNTITLEGSVASQARKLVSISMNDDIGGTVWLVGLGSETEERIIQDTVGWGTDSKPAVCYEAAQTKVPKDGESLRRCVQEDGFPRDTDNNEKDFFINTVSAPKNLPCTSVGSGETTTNDTSPPSEETSGSAAPQTTYTCQDIQLSEVLPNPLGSDSGIEYVELFNSGDKAQALEGCSVVISHGSKTIALPGSIVLKPGEYRALTSHDVPGLQLVNGGDEITFSTSSTDTQIQYPSADDEQAWAMFGGTWQITYEPTPNAPNSIYVPPDPAPVTQAETEYADCPAGKYRSPETNRCKNIETQSDSLVACSAGQERNLQTNRCRNIGSSTTALTPCKEGYERNPDTNRCRKTSVLAESILKDCPAGQERNAETNRCRKSSTLISTASANGNAAKTIQKSSQNLPVLLFVLGLAGVYAAYEYRYDLANFYHRVVSKNGKLKK